MAAAGGLAYLAWPHAESFYGACDNMARYSLSHPQLLWKSNGQVVDDYRERWGAARL